MFLGGLPSIEENIKHYTKLNDIFTNKLNFYIVVHPLVLESEINIKTSNLNFLSIFEQSNVFIVDDKHHIPTSWSSQSLVDATLLMIQYAHKQNGSHLFDKYILLSSTCVPIFTFDEIYKEIVVDDKSWINFMLKDYDEKKISEPYNKYDVKINGSQWMILDKKHISMFFVSDRYSDTYYINNDDKTQKTMYYCKGKILKNISINHLIETENNESNDKIIGPLNESIEKINLMKKHFNKLNDDEFNELIKILTSNENLESFVRTLTITNYKDKKNKKIIETTLTEIIDKQTEEKNITEKNKQKINNQVKTLNDLFNYFYKVYKKCNHPVDEIFFCRWILHTLIKPLVSSKTGKIDSGNDNSKYKKILSDNFKITEFNGCNTDLHIYECKLNKLSQNVINSLNKISKTNEANGIKQIKPIPRVKTNKYNINGLDIIIPQIQFSINAIIMADEPLVMLSSITPNPMPHDYYFVSSTYTDWCQTAIDPFNIFRDFSKFKAVGETKINVKSYLNKTESFSVLYLFLDNNIETNVSDITYENGKINVYKLITAPIAHPVEYSEWNLINVLNGFYLLNWLVNNNYIDVTNELDDLIKMLNKTFIIYKKIILEYINGLTESDKLMLNETIFLTRDKLEFLGQKIDQYINTVKIKKIAETKFATPITSSTLVSAILCNSLFIRKSLEGSNINTFTEFLKTLKINELFSSTKNTKDKRIITTSSNNDDLFNTDYVYMLKYYKYKQKYLNLKNKYN